MKGKHGQQTNWRKSLQRLDEIAFGVLYAVNFVVMQISLEGNLYTQFEVTVLKWSNVLPQINRLYV